MDIAFISCVSKKAKFPLPAKDLYVSDLFKKSYNYCNKRYDKIYILSAKYGMLDVNTVIKPYDLTLNNFKEQQKKEWAYKVYQSISQSVNQSDVLYWHCGMNYRKYLMRVLRNKQVEPLKGLGIGVQLKWYKDRL